MKDFDVQVRENHAKREADMGDRSFVLGGETFTYRSTVSYTVLEYIANTSALDGGDLIANLERGCVDLLEEGQGERFLAVLRSTENPLSFSDLNEVCTWLTEVQVNRPTLAPSPSTSGDAPTSIASTEDSSSKPAVVSAA